MNRNEHTQLMIALTALSLQNSQSKLKSLEIDNIDIKVLIDVIERLNYNINTLNKLLQ